MGGHSYDDEWDFAAPKTILFLGRTGNGKSATANSIIGKNVFNSYRSASGVTKCSELKITVLEDGHQMLHLIDTPGLFDSSVDPEFIGKEIVSCINLARDGIHAFVLVFSICSRFSNEEEAVISNLIAIFGTKIFDYIIIIFTGGDLLDNENKTLEDFLHECPPTLEEILCLCGNRCVLFDNKTNDIKKRTSQLEKLLDLVNMVSKKNGRPYTNEIFTELKSGTKYLQEQTNKFQVLKETNQYTEQEISLLTEPMRDVLFKRMFEMVESKLKENTIRFEQLLEDERVARIKAEENAKAAEIRLAKNKRDLREELEMRQRVEVQCETCSIL